MEGWVATVMQDVTPGAVGIWIAVGMLAVHFIREWRENRKLSADDRVARREGYETQVRDLRTENRALIDDLRSLRKEYDEHRKLCQQETDQLRDMLVAVQDELQGLKRKVAVDAIELAQLRGFGG